MRCAGVSLLTVLTDRCRQRRRPPAAYLQTAVTVVRTTIKSVSGTNAARCCRRRGQTIFLGGLRRAEQIGAERRRRRPLVRSRSHRRSRREAVEPELSARFQLFYRTGICGHLTSPSARLCAGQGRGRCLRTQRARACMPRWRRAAGRRDRQAQPLPLKSPASTRCRISSFRTGGPGSEDFRTARRPVRRRSPISTR